MDDEEEVTARLLRLAGARADAPGDRTVRIRDTVRREWRSNRRRRARRRGLAITAATLAAAAVLLMVARHVPRDRVVAPEQVIATGERVEGAPILRRTVDGRPVVVRLVSAASIRSEDVIETDGSSRASLRSTDGSSVRIDHRSRLRLVAPGVLELSEGGLYVATSDGSRGLEVRTAMGIVHDVGTQFEVRLEPASLRVRVRTGLVEIRRREGVAPTHAGAETTVTPAGVATRRVLTYGPEWDWAAGLATPFDIEGRSLQAFLDHLTREQGWTLRYADQARADAASRIILHGSIAGLSPADALRVALATSGLEYRLRAGELLVSPSAGGR